MGVFGGVETMLPLVCMERKRGMDCNFFNHHYGGDPPRTLSKYQRDSRGSLFGQRWDPISPKARVSRRGGVPRILSENRLLTAVVSLVQPVVKSAHFFQVGPRRKISVLTNGKTYDSITWQVEFFFSLLESEYSGNFFPLSMCFGKTRFLS